MLIDSFGREHDYLRISVTDRCDLRCMYCMPEGGIELEPSNSQLTIQELSTLTRIFADLGIRKLRITGGEPLVRHDILALLNRLGKTHGIEEFAMSTNGTHLTRHLEEIWNSGIRQLNISLDTLHPDRFVKITKANFHQEVLQAIEAAIAFQPHFDFVKLNVVVIRNVNDDEIVDFVNYGMKLCELVADADNGDGPQIEIRFIEYMPFSGNDWDISTVVPYSEMHEKISAQFDLESVSLRTSSAKVFFVKGTPLRVGFIPSITDPFCADCNRLRLTSQGVLRTCLFGGASVDLRAMLRSGATIDRIKEGITGVTMEKWERHPEPVQLQLSNIPMVMIGG